MTIKKIALWLLALGLVLAGINHFWHPKGYLSIMPPWLPQPTLLHLLAGVVEMICGVLLLFPKTRKLAAYTIVAMLLAFIPVHIFMIQKKGCMGTEICIPLWAAWLRLIPGQLLLIAWAWWVRR